MVFHCSTLGDGGHKCDNKLGPPTQFEGKLLFPIMYSVIIMMASLYGCKSALTILLLFVYKDI